jgi:hypothetical protein
VCVSKRRTGASFASAPACHDGSRRSPKPRCDRTGTLCRSWLDGSTNGALAGCCDLVRWLRLARILRLCLPTKQAPWFRRSGAEVDRQQLAHGSQEQTQIISTAKGRPTPRAPPMVNANAESKSVSNSRPDMTRSKEPPRAFARCPKDKRSKKQAIETTGNCPVPTILMLKAYG